jgi:chromosome segregation ATPase
MRREQRFQEEQGERERSMMDIRDSQNRLGRAATYGDDEDEGIGYRRAGKSEADRKLARSRYQFEATASDDELEDEIDDNIDQIGDTASRLNKLALAMGQEINSQNERLDRIAGKTDKLTMRIDNNTDKVRELLSLSSEVCSNLPPQLKRIK